MKKRMQEQQYTLTGMAGTMGAAFTSPLFAGILAGELSPTPKRSYVAAFIPALFAATLGYVIYFGVTGTTMLGSYALPAYEFKFGHLLIGALLGILAAFILILFALIRKLTFAVFSKIPNSLVFGKYTYASLMQEHALYLGVPKKAILLEGESESTKENALFTKEILKRYGYTSLILVTSPFHSKRAFKIFNKIMGGEIKIISAPSEESSFQFKDWWKRERDRKTVLTEFSNFSGSMFLEGKKWSLEFPKKLNLKRIV